ncbi:hypothetical protein EVAR_15104_1 [Eumeta japonica]|uniref:Uncharacterized protein n=1 Tax=Eumeta variegata TaxID=151549 RepID=A0A4C1UHZ8_EUMVA|nr:hypothetical protein EVAR_15104_1 [Eumeta japonica]
MNKIRDINIKEKAYFESPRDGMFACLRWPLFVCRLMGFMPIHGLARRHRAETRYKGFLIVEGQPSMRAIKKQAIIAAHGHSLTQNESPLRSRSLGVE